MTLRAILTIILAALLPSVAVAASYAPFMATACVPPSNVVEPIISGTLTSGQVVTTSNGTWAGAAASFTYQWLRCADFDPECASPDLIGSGANTYTLTPAEVGGYIGMTVTAHNSCGAVPFTTSRGLVS